MICEMETAYDARWYWNIATEEWKFNHWKSDVITFTIELEMYVIISCRWNQ